MIILRRSNLFKRLLRVARNDTSKVEVRLKINMKAIKNKINNKNIKLAIVVSRFNDFISKRLLAGCLNELKKNGVSEKSIIILWVPGVFEIPVTALKFAKSKNIQAIICLGAVIRGETFHFELVAESAARGILEVSLQTQKPVIFGVLSTDTVDQAYKRSEEKGDNKGKDAALAALEMINVLSSIKA